MPKTLARYVNKSVMGDAYSGDQMLDINNTITIDDDYIYINNISTGINIKGSPGKTAYELAVAHGFIGTEEEWLESLRGYEGNSAYEVAINNGFVGTEEEWLESLKGRVHITTEVDPEGQITKYIVVDNGTNLKGASAYEIAIDNGFIGTEAEWLESLKGKDGKVQIITEVDETNGGIIKHINFPTQ